MKKILILLLCLIGLQCFAQNKSEIGISFGSGSCDLMSFAKTVGGAGYSGDGYFAFGITYINPIYSWLGFETGLEYSDNKITISSNLPPQYPKVTRHEKIGLLSVPIACRINFLKYAFLNGGLLFDVDTNLSPSVHSQSGIGALLGIGLKYDFKSGITLAVNPNLRIHRIISFNRNGSDQRLIDSGVKLGIGYRF